MKAVILAAGAGTRLCSEAPKALLEIGGRTILERTLHGLAETGVAPGDVTVVTGFRESLFAGMGLNLVHNRLWRFPGTLSSFFAWEGTQGDTLVLHGDLVWESRLLAGIANAPGDIVVPVDPARGDDPEAMKAEVRGERVLHLSKSLPGGRSAGESMGVFLIRDPIRLKRMSAHLAHEPHKSLDDAVNVAAGRVAVNAFFTSGAFWEEIDTMTDLQRARSMFS